MIPKRIWVLISRIQQSKLLCCKSAWQEVGTIVPISKFRSSNGSDDLPTAEQAPYAPIESAPIEPAPI